MVLACHSDIRDYIIRNNYSCHQKFLKVITSSILLISLQILEFFQLRNESQATFTNNKSKKAFEVKMKTFSINE
ncbi:hypothetical protein T01_1826 [Trichinella spiralis]|uniref:Uncharacterized protein n=1 Tax=Trichinella spiralis TaxID=6334 RepID=A0A0V1BHT0_TRISP|nr:hypothetical protein T01_1826 [Trichinella spiralis]